MKNLGTLLNKSSSVPPHIKPCSAIVSRSSASLCEMAVNYGELVVLVAFTKQLERGGSKSLRSKSGSSEISMLCSDINARELGGGIYEGERESGEVYRPDCHLRQTQLFICPYRNQDGDIKAIIINIQCFIILSSSLV